ncbi:MAG TPA: gamma-glutamyl-gamma-aminobutyrate hydrolase family protein [Candidatus Limnocylindria bacterium]|nr:gamma-glutamyl-gamma-aminobutyrate hydrolase family protein [Candidatus Limnocylindria bacterium]
MSAGINQKPRVGIPYRTRKEELNGERAKYDKYVQAVESVGGDPIRISLGLSSDELKTMAQALDAIVLPGSPADVDPSLYRAARNPKSSEADSDRERTDFVLLNHAFTEHKPVLAICYGVQSLNVFLGGSLIQDIPAEVRTQIQHPWIGRDKGVPEPFHTVRFEPGSRLALSAGALEATVNSSHHQSVLDVGRGLRIAARAADGVIEGVEWTGDANWVTGVQWHPERMAETDSLAQVLFRDLIAAAHRAPVSI